MNEKLKQAGYGKRTLSHLIDLTIVGVLGLILFSTVTSKYYEKAIGGYDDVDTAYRFLGDSGLFNTTEKDGYVQGFAVKSYYATPEEAASAAASSSSGGGAVQSENGYVLYLHDVYNYYRSFLPTNEHIDGISDSAGVTTKASEYYTVNYFNTKILKFLDPATVDVASEASRAGSNTYFMYAVKDGKVDPDGMPVLKSDYQTKVDAKDQSTLTALNHYFFYAVSSNSYSGLFYDAAINALGQSYYTNHLTSYQVKTWSALAVAVAPLALVFFLIIPLCKRNDETVGKMIVGLAVVDENGYSVRGYKKVLHPVLVTFEVMTFLIYPTVIGIMVFMLLSLLDYMSSVISKNRLSFHEKIAHTKVIDAKASVWFASPEAEENYIATHPEVYKKAAATPNLHKTDPAEESAIAAEDSILDLNKIEKARAEADAITNFDEFEKNKDAELAKKDGASKEVDNKPSVDAAEDKKEDAKKESFDNGGFTDGK